jgi:DNA-directed RNA polymerase subunit RPC12/RpoP
MSAEQARARTGNIVVTATDILFECPACGKSLVVEETAEGMIIDCPQCRTNIIVPPRPSASGPPPAATREESKPPDDARSSSSAVPAQKRLAVLAGQLKEIQTQRTEVTNRIAARLNDVNRDLVMMARLDTSQQQILREWNQLVESVSTATHAADADPSRPVVIGAGVTENPPSRVSFRK